MLLYNAVKFIFSPNIEHNDSSLFWAVLEGDPMMKRLLRQSKPLAHAGPSPSPTGLDSHQWKGGFPKPGPLCSSLAMHGLFQGLMRALCPLAGCIVPLSILGHVWFVVSCGDSLQCPSQALSPRVLVA